MVVENLHCVSISKTLGVRCMMNYLYITLLLIFTSSLTAEEKGINPDYIKLLRICSEHPEFEPSSISFFEIEKAVEHEKEYFRMIRKLHRYEGMEFLLDKLNSAKSDNEKNCVKGLLSTWPG